MTFRQKYNIYTIALNAHTEEAASEFVSIPAKADEIVEYFKAKNIDTLDIYTVFLSLGKLLVKLGKGLS